MLGPVETGERHMTPECLLFVGICLCRRSPPAGARVVMTTSPVVVPALGGNNLRFFSDSGDPRGAVVGVTGGWRVFASPYAPGVGVTRGR